MLKPLKPKIRCPKCNGVMRPRGMVTSETICFKCRTNKPQLKAAPLTRAERVRMLREYILNPPKPRAFMTPLDAAGNPIIGDA